MRESPRLAPVQSNGFSTGAIWLKAANHPVTLRYFHGARQRYLAWSLIFFFLAQGSLSEEPSSLSPLVSIICLRYPLMPLLQLPSHRACLFLPLAPFSLPLILSLSHTLACIASLRFLPTHPFAHGIFDAQRHWPHTTNWLWCQPYNYYYLI